jgi:hypothetical protein
MINWQSVIFNSFWILGLAIMLAAFSYNYWLAKQEGHTLRKQLSGRLFLRPFWLAVVLVGIGLAGTSQRNWELAIWIVLTVIALVVLVDLFRN